jgi:acetolactate synthase-1/2/3 large subunit
MSGRRVLALEGDGSACIPCGGAVACGKVSTAASATLAIEAALRIGGAGNPGRKAEDMLSLNRPDLDWVALATGMGVPATRATTAEEFNNQLARSLAAPGPGLIEVVL